MKNMKRFLSVAMAVLMMFALVISASAKTIYEFDDTKDVAANSDNRSYLSSNKYFEDALQMMVDLEIITGRATSGELNLDASAPVTRLEFVTMLYKFMNGGSVPNESFAAMNPFTDIPWGAQYAGWAHSSGIAAGIGDNKFGSSNSIKMVDAVTFLIKALGVNTEYENFTGDNYSTQAMIIGNYLGLIPGDFSVASQNALTRAEVACLFNFALDATMQEYQVSYNGTIAVYIRKDASQAAIQKFFGYDRYEGELVANNVFALDGFTKTSKADQTKLGVRQVNGVDKTMTLTLSSDVGLENIGRSFYMYAKLDQTNTISKMSGFNITGTSTTYGTGAYVSANGKYISTGGSYYRSSTQVSDVAIVPYQPYVAPTTSTSGDGIAERSGNVYVNYTHSVAADLSLSADADATVNDVFGLGGTGNNLRLVESDYETYYFIEKLTSAKVQSISSGEATLRTSANVYSGTASNISDKIKTANIIGDSVAAGDYILFAKVGSSDANLVTKATLLEGRAEYFVSGNLRIDGTNYSRYAVTGATPFNSDITTPGDYNYYLVGGKIIGVASAGATAVSTGANICYVREIYRSGGGTSSTSWDVRVYSQTDTTGKWYTVSSASSGYSSIGTSSYIGNAWEYTISGSNITLKTLSISSNYISGFNSTTGAIGKYAGEVSLNYRLTGAAFTAGEKDMNNANASIRVDGGSVFFLVKKDGSVTVASGRSPSFNAQSNAIDAPNYQATPANVDNDISESKFFTRDGTGSTGVLRAAIIKAYKADPDDSYTYVWGTGAGHYVNSDNSGVFYAWDGSKETKYEFDSSTIYSNNNGTTSSVPVGFNPNTLLKLRIVDGDITEIHRIANGDGVRNITHITGTPSYDQFISYGIGCYNDFTLSVERDGVVKIVDTAVKDGRITEDEDGNNIVYWDEYGSSWKFVLVDKTGDSTVYKNITSEIKTYEFSDDVDYTYYIEYVGTSGVSSNTDPIAKTGVIWIIAE